MGSAVSSIKFERVEQAAQESLVFGTTIPGKAGWVATIEMADGGRWIADKLDGETDWIVNGEWLPGRSMPRFWNGQLSRCTIPVKLSPTDAEIVERNFLAFLVVLADTNRASLR